MVVAEYRGKMSTVRIHDECCGQGAEDCMASLNQIVSGFYRRRQLEGRPESVAAMGLDGPGGSKTAL